MQRARPLLESLEWRLVPSGNPVTVVLGSGLGSAPLVRVFGGDGAPGGQIRAYDSRFGGGVRVAVGDVTGDGVPDVITAPGADSGPHVRVWDGATRALVRQFMAFEPTFAGGVYVAAGDVNGDGFADIVCGAGAGAAPRVRVFSGKDGSVLADFLAYDPLFPGGVRVAAGDVNGDGYADVVTGAGPGGGPHVEVFSGKDGSLLRSFRAYARNVTGGLFVAAGDVDGDYRADVITGSAADAGGRVKVFGGATGALLETFTPFADAGPGGVRVAAADLTGDGQADVIAGTGPGAVPAVRVYNGATGTVWGGAPAFAAPPGDGVLVAAGASDPGRTTLPASQVRGMLNGLHLLNYYPAADAQTNMWTHWNPAAVDADFARAAALHANAVRIALFPDAFGYPEPSALMTGRLAQLMGLARNHGLRLKLVLFGLWSDFADVAGAKQWARSVLSPYRDDPTIAYVDVMNEIDVPGRGSPSWQANLVWARELVPFVRDLVGSVPVTASLSGNVAGRGVADLRAARVPVDFYEVHYYGLPELAGRFLADAVRDAGGAPLFVGETGTPTRPNDPAGRTPAWWESYQDQYLRTVEQAAASLGLPDVSPWTLNDYTADAFAGVPGTPPDAAEYSYGLYRTDGSAKPAARSVAAIFGGAAADLSFDNGFESNDGAGMPANWLLWDSADARFGRDTSVKHSGLASARIGGSANCGTAEPGYYVSPVQVIQPGKTYAASAWARGERATGMTRVELVWFGADGNYLETVASASLAGGTNGWTLLSVSAAAPSAAAFVQIHLVSANNAGTVWFDDVTFG